MAMNIKSDEAQQLAHKLSQLTGESLTAAVTEAVRERLDRVENTQRERLAVRLRRIGKDCAAHLKTRFRSEDHADLLYDERGLPK